MNKATNARVTYRSGVNLTMSCKGHLKKCWVSTQPITEANLNNIPLIRTSSTFPLQGGRQPSPLEGEGARRAGEGFPRGFTLIELLVVVLIIGILVAVALPQYQKAVEHSRMAEAMQRLGDYASAQQVYYMRNNGFASDYAALNQGDIQVPEQTEVGNWDTDDSRWEITSASGSSLEKIEMSAQRMSGIFEGCVLTLTVEANGHIDKTCQGNEDCCAAAQGGGYGEAPAETPGGGNSGSGGSNTPVTLASSNSVSCEGRTGVYQLGEMGNCGTNTFSDGTSISYDVEIFGIPMGILITEYDSLNNEIGHSYYTDDAWALEQEGSKSLEQLCEDYPLLQMLPSYEGDWHIVSCN